MATAVDDLVNQALREGGVKRRIGSVYEGTEAAKTALELYGQARDELLRSEDWDFARRTLALTLLKGPPPAGGYYPGNLWNSTFPPTGWLYEYAYPGDCLQVAAIVPQPGNFPVYDPKPAVWRIDNDNALSLAAKVILTNVRNAVAIYRAQVIDPSTWNASFTATLIARLAAKFAIALSGSLDLAKAEDQEAAGEAAIADVRRG